MGYGFGLWFGLVLHRKIRLTQLWVELSWVVAISNSTQLYLSQTLLLFDCIFGATSLKFYDKISVTYFLILLPV